MKDATPLDRAAAAMDADPASDAARLRFFERLAEGELFLLLGSDPEGDRIEPEIFDTEDGRFALAFDREERLTAFTGRPSPYAALSGRRLAAMLAPEGIGLGLNLSVVPSARLIPSEALDWLRRTLGDRPEIAEERPVEIHPPTDFPEPMLARLDAKLATAAGLARAAYLVGATYRGGRDAHMLAVIDPVPGAEVALASAVHEALVFSGHEGAQAIDVTFVASTDAFAARLSGVGLRFDLPRPSRPVAPKPDPDAPPRLR